MSRLLLRVPPRARLAIGLLACSIPGCASPPPARTATPVDPQAEAQALQRIESQLLDELAAADPRMARRSGVEPSAAALSRALQVSLAAEEPVVAIGKSLDVFSRTARAEALRRGSEQLDTIRPVDDDGPLRRRVEGLRAFIHDERARAQRESSLPQGAVRLLHASVETVEMPATADERQTLDGVLAENLGSIEDSLHETIAPLDSLDAAAIAQALDPLESKLAQLGLGEALRASTSLRLATDLVTQPPAGSRRLPSLRGETNHDVDRARLETLRTAMRADLARRWESRGQERDDLERAAARALFASAPCARPRSGSGPRVAPGDELQLACRSLLAARTSGDPALADLVIHDLLTLALWTYEIAAERADYHRVIGRYALASHVPADDAARLVRMLSAEPEIGLEAGRIAEAAVAHGQGGASRASAEVLETLFGL